LERKPALRVYGSYETETTMKLKRVVLASTAVAGIGAAGLFGLGIGTASADPGQCGGPGPQGCQGPNNGWNNGPGDGHNDWNNGPGNGPGNWNNGPVDWHNRGIDQGRQDHQPFNWNGQWVQPVPAGNGMGWGFWFLNQWIPL
jgi:hypothetical protein